MEAKERFDYDYIIIGSGFGGSVCAMRLCEKGYSVLVLEKGKRWTAEDYPKRNWNLRKWLWLPVLRFSGFFKLTFFRHVGILSGVGVGGGSLVYANTLERPKHEYFESETWRHLADWKSELEEHYSTAERMLGVTQNPRLEEGDEALRKVSEKIGKADCFAQTKVGIFFGEPDVAVADPYFEGEGPERSGCNFCGGCMVGCRFNAKNTLDKNYLYLAEKRGCRVQPESEVYDVKPLDDERGSSGYEVKWKSSVKLIKKRGSYTCLNIVFAGGVLGTVPLLLKLKQSSLPRLSDRAGKRVRTNSESLMGIVTFHKNRSFCDGIAIGSILHTDEHSHIEPVRYASGSGFWRVMIMPLVHGPNVFSRIGRLLMDFLAHPLKNLRAYTVRDFARSSQILLYMRTLEGSLSFHNGRFRMHSRLEEGAAPTAFMPEAKHLAEAYSETVNGKPYVLLTETLLGIPTTAHILGGAVMGRDETEGVIDKDHRVFGYDNMYICDGSSISSNPGVNPSLTITALAERAMSKIAAAGPQKGSADKRHWD